MKEMAQTNENIQSNTYCTLNVAKSQSNLLNLKEKEKGKEEKQREIKYESIPDSQSC